MRKSLLLVLALLPSSGCPASGGTPFVPTDDAGDTADLTAPPGSDLTMTGTPDMTVAHTPDLSTMHPPDLAQPPTYSTQVQVFVEPGADFTPVIDAIDRAAASVHMEMYYLGESTVIDALIRAHSAGKDVKVILEQHPMGPSNSYPYSSLMNAGVPVQWSNSAKFTYTHAKSVVLDGTSLLAMTMNMSGAAVSGNREYLILDTDPADAAEADAIFNADWTNTTATAGRLAVSPINSRQRIDALISTAQSELDIEWEELADSDVGYKIQSRAKAGAQVKIIVPSSVVGSGNGTEMLLMSLKQVSGIQVRTMSSPNVHAKMILVDRTTGFVGSENATATSLGKNREMGVVWSNASVASTCGSTFDSDWSSANPF